MVQPGLKKGRFVLNAVMFAIVLLFQMVAIAPYFAMDRLFKQKKKYLKINQV